MSTAENFLKQARESSLLDAEAQLKVLPQVITIGSDRMEEVCRLEARCYPSPWSPELIRNEFAKDISYRLGLLLDDKLIAYSFAYLIPEDLHLLNLAVDPEYRTKGYGTYLLCNLLSRAIVRDVRNVFLEVRASNWIAQRLYKRLGFCTVGTRRGYYRNNGEDAVLLELQLSPRSIKFLEKFSRLVLCRDEV